jgi:hypothetical protein
MPALYIPKAGTFDGILSQLETVNAIDPTGYTELQRQYRRIKQLSLRAPKDENEANVEAEEVKEENAPVTILQLTAFALKNPDFKQQISTEYLRLKKEKPEKKERHELSRWQQEIKEEESLDRRALDLQGRKDFTLHLQQRLKAKLKTTNPHANGHDVLTKLQDDAKVLHRMLTPSTKITRHDGQVTETTYDIEQFLDNPPDIIFVMGNNDLRQIDFIAELYHAAKGASPHKFPKIYVSGFGGHGTMHDPVFSLQEGQTMVKRLLDLGVKIDDIRIEHDAVDTGRNVKYMDIYLLIEYALREQEHLKNQHLLDENGILFLKNMSAHSGLHMLEVPNQKRTPEEEEALEKILAPLRKQIIENHISIFDNILVSGTPGGLRRQTSTLEQQKVLPWKNISCLTPFEFSDYMHTDLLDDYYYPTLPKASINFIYALREVASYLDYTVNTEYLSKRPLPDAENLKSCICIYAEYYNLMLEEKYRFEDRQLFLEKKIDGNKLAAAFIEFSEQKNRGVLNSVLIKKLNTAIKPTADYFRRAFLDVELEKLHHISLRRKMTLTEQARELDTSGTFGRQDLITYPFFKFNVKKVASAPSSEMEYKPESRHKI